MLFVEKLNELQLTLLILFFFQLSQINIFIILLFKLEIRFEFLDQNYIRVWLKQIKKLDRIFFSFLVLV